MLAFGVNGDWDSRSKDARMNGTRETILQRPAADTILQMFQLIVKRLRNTLPSHQ